MCASVERVGVRVSTFVRGYEYSGRCSQCSSSCAQQQQWCLGQRSHPLTHVGVAVVHDDVRSVRIPLPPCMYAYTIS